MKNILGFTSLEEYTFSKKAENSGTHAIFLEKEQKQIIFKPEDLEKCYRELFYTDIYSFLNLPHVNYDLGFRSGFIGVFAINYNPQGHKVEFIDQIIKEYNEKQKKQINYNKHDLEQLLKQKYEKVVEQKDYFKKQLFLFFIMQILTANDDFHMRNMEIIHGKNISFSPFFDYNHCGKIKFKTGISYQFNYKKSDNNAKEELISFLQEATKEELEIFKLYFEKLKWIQWKELFAQREEQIHAKILLPYKILLKREFENNLKNIEIIFKKVRRL